MTKILNSSKKISTQTVKYIHEEHVHNFKAAEVVIPYIMQLLKPISVVDVGCGIGTWIKVFEDQGVEKVLGIDGDYVDEKLLKIEKSKFLSHDLEKDFFSKEKYDLAISLEVAEHLSIDSAVTFINTLSNLSDTVVFSAAIPNQGGQNHLNEQSPEYWITIFESLGFKMYDVFRPVFWDNKIIDVWYRQNMLLFTRDSSLFAKLDLLDNFKGKHIVHPDFFQQKENQLVFYKRQFNRINDGKKDGRVYFKLIIKYVQSRLKEKR